MHASADLPRTKAARCSDRYVLAPALAVFCSTRQHCKPRVHNRGAGQLITLAQVMNDEFSCAPLDLPVVGIIPRVLDIVIF